MPISKAKQALYPGGSIRSPEWRAIRAAVQERAGNCCEGCGVPNDAIGVRLPSGMFLPVPGTVGVLVEIAPGAVFKRIRIVCTTAHVDGGLSDHSMGNLRFWCQRCHNRHDAGSRAQNAAITRRLTAGKPNP